MKSVSVIRTRTGLTVVYLSLSHLIHPMVKKKKKQKKKIIICKDNYRGAPINASIYLNIWLNHKLNINPLADSKLQKK